MSGSGSREGFGSPPWDPAEPVPEREDTQTIHGLGAIPGPGRGTAPGGPYRPDAASPGAGGWRDNGHGGDPGLKTGTWQGNGRGAPGPGAGGLPGTGQPGPGQPPPGAAGGTGAPGEGAGPGGKSPQPGAKRPRRRSFMRELPVLIVVALVLALVIKTYAIQAFYIPSASMENTLDIGDRVLINKLVYDFRSIHRGDIVVFDGNGSWDFNQPPSNSNIFSRFWSDIEGIVGISHDTTIYIKRVIGLPGDHVACCNAKGQVTVNRVPLSEQSYLYPGNVPSTDRFNITVPEGRL